MNQTIIIGNLTKDPELRSTSSGVSVCAFTVAVNRQGANGDNAATFFDVSAWREMGEACARYLRKGNKVAVVGEVSASAYTSRDGKAHASLRLTARNVEFLTPKQQQREDDCADDAGFMTLPDDVDCPF